VLRQQARRELESATATSEKITEALNEVHDSRNTRSSRTSTQALVAAPLREPQPTVDFIGALAPVGAPALVVVVVLAVVMNLSDEL
jgi:hypothetical protein